jgi:hypothetical protein
MAKPRRAPEAREVPEQPMTRSEAEREKGVEIPSGRDLHRRYHHPQSEITPEDVTGINPEKMKPIDPRMVYIPPA